MANVKLYREFLGLWQLIPESCQYEQGDAPTSGSYQIEEQDDGTLMFTARWTDADGKEDAVSFSGKADGVKVPFESELVDSFAVEAVSARELNTYAYHQGRELMVAQRQLDASGQAMRITQLVRLPHGHSPANVSVYRRVTPN